MNEIHAKLVGDFYRALKTKNTDLLWNIQTDDVVYNISGHSPVSGRIQGKENVARDIIPYVLSGLQIETFEFAKKWKIVCSDADRIVAFMEADGLGVNGERYNPRYVHMFSFRDDKISGVWEFFDTLLADRVCSIRGRTCQSRRC